VRFIQKQSGERFRLLRTLSETRTSTVHLAEDTEFGLVAVKVLTPALVRADDFRNAVLRTADLDHPNIVPVHLARTDGEPFYLVMPYVDGPNLREILGHGPPELPWTARLIREVASALDFAHAAGIVHRDVKPGNILVDRVSGRALLCDFGIAAVGARTTEAIGTPGFVAPELIPGRGRAPVDPRADVYSLGAVLYLCLTGRPPYEHTDVNALLWAQGHDDPPPVTAVRPDLPKALDGVLATALARRPRDRYPTCLALAEAVSAAGRGE